MTNDNDHPGGGSLRTVVLPGVMTLVGVLLGGAITGLTSVMGIKMQLDENNRETARKERVTAYTNFFYSANKADKRFAELQECIRAEPKPKTACRPELDLARASQRSLTGAFEILQVYATDRALAEAAELKRLLAKKQLTDPSGGTDVLPPDETFQFEKYRAVRDRFTLAMCGDLSPQPRSDCSHGSE